MVLTDSEHYDVEPVDHSKRDLERARRGPFSPLMVKVFGWGLGLLMAVISGWPLIENQEVPELFNSEKVSSDHYLQ